MKKLEQFYNLIPEDVRERYGITFMDDDYEKYVNIKNGVWTNICEKDVAFDKCNDGVEVLNYSVTLYLHNLAVVLRRAENPVQLIVY